MGAEKLPPIERDGPREYIPLPGGWEFQTKGDGSSTRLLDRKTGQRLNIMGADADYALEHVATMAREIHAAWNAAIATPVAASPTPDSVVRAHPDEMAVDRFAAAIIADSNFYLWDEIRNPALRDIYRRQARAVLAALKGGGDA